MILMKETKFYFQTHDSTCMATCLNMIFDDLAGTNEGPNADCEDNVPLGRRALSRLTKKKGERYGLKAKLVWKLQPDAYKLEPGSLVLLKFDSNSGHCIIFDGIENGKVKVRDPTRVRRLVDVDGFDRRRPTDRRTEEDGTGRTGTGRDDDGRRRTSGRKKDRRTTT
jgi:ABC-type bacteriocin/lantibiotic exporter with double-glycine peptidase domain